MGGHVGKHSCESDATGEDQAVDACELAQRRVACVAGVVWPDTHVRGGECEDWRATTAQTEG